MDPHQNPYSVPSIPTLSSLQGYGGSGHSPDLIYTSQQEAQQPQYQYHQLDTAHQPQETYLAPSVPLKKRPPREDGRKRGPAACMACRKLLGLSLI